MTPREKKEVKRNNFHASLYKRLGESIEKLWDLGLNAEWLKQDEEIFEGSFVENPSMTRALSLGASAAPSIGWLGGLAKLTKSTTLASVMLAGADADDIYFEARKAGASQNKALGLFAVGTAGTAAFDKYGFEQLFSQKVTAPLAKRVVNSMLSEGVTEGTQTLWQNMVKKYGYDDSQELWEAVIESVIGGALSGGAISAANAGYVRLQDVRGRLQEKGMSENGLDQVQEALVQEMGFHREGLEPLFQTRIEQSLNKLDDFVRQSEETAEAQKAQQIKADLDEVYNKVFDRIKTSDTDKVAAAQAKVVQGVALWGSQELGISPLEYFEQRFPRIERVAYRDFARRLNEAKRAGEVAEINLYEALKNPALLKGQKVKDTRQSLTQFLKQNGGLKDFGGELKARYFREVVSGDSYTIDLSGAKQKDMDMTIDLILRMSSVLPVSLAAILGNPGKWMNDDVPDFSEPGEYWIAFTNQGGVPDIGGLGGVITIDTSNLNKIFYIKSYSVKSNGKSGTKQTGGNSVLTNDGGGEAGGGNATTRGAGGGGTSGIGGKGGIGGDGELLIRYEGL